MQDSNAALIAVHTADTIASNNHHVALRLAVPLAKEYGCEELAAPQNDEPPPLVFARCHSCGTLYPHTGHCPNCPHS